MIATQFDITTTFTSLFGHTLKAYRVLLQERLAALDLHIGQDITLIYLWEEDGVTQSELAERLNIQQATMTTVLRRMCKAGLIERRKDAQDQRVWRIYPTEKANALRDDIMALRQNLEETLLETFTLEERVLLRRLMLQLHDTIVAATSD